MTAHTIFLDRAEDIKSRPSVDRAHNGILVALAFVAIAMLGMLLLPPHSPNDPSQVDASEIVAGP